MGEDYFAVFGGLGIKLKRVGAQAQGLVKGGSFMSMSGESVFKRKYNITGIFGNKSGKCWPVPFGSNSAVSVTAVVAVRRRPAWR